MNWNRYQTVLLLLACVLIVLCRTEKACNGEMWIEPKAVYNGEPFNVFCRCNGSKVNVQDVTIQDGDSKEKWNTTKHDEYTVVHRVPHTCGNKYYKIDCMHKDEVLLEASIKVAPFLYFKDYNCSYVANGKKVNCSFEEFDFAASIPKKNYSMKIDDNPSNSCSQEDQSNVVICEGSNPPKPPNSTCKPDPKIELTLNYAGLTQSQVFQMTQNPPLLWPNSQPQFFQNATGVYLNWTHSSNVPHLRHKQNWKVQIRPQNPKIDVIRFETLVDPLDTIIGLLQLPFANQLYSFWFERICAITDALWSPVFKSKKFRSNATVPAHPPELIPNGYSHNPEKNELTVYWQHLDELDQNGPNFTYNAATNSGKKPSSVDNNTATFSNWDITLPAIINVWCQNSAGNSTINWLEIPTLAGSNNRQPRNVRYHEHNYTLIWDPPADMLDHSHYVISWCFCSPALTCDNEEYIYYELVSGWECMFVFSESMVEYNLGVCAVYDSIRSGGICWLLSSLFFGEGSSHSSLDLSQAIAVLVVVVWIVIQSLLH